ncbi:MAG: MFS transporter [Oscillospiraceae bacterium]
MMKNFKFTMRSSQVGIFVQAIVCTITALLFIPLKELYGFSYADLGILVAINFFSQVAVDIVFSKAIDKVGYKRLVLPAVALSFFGLVLFGLTPNIFPNHIFLGIIIATVIFAASSGLLELLLSPMINSIPSENKGATMSFMHSFYAWGQVATIILTTLAIFIFKKESWQFIVLAWSVVPVVCFFMFCNAEFPKTIAIDKANSAKKILFQPFYLLCLAAIFFGASTEVVMNQWASTFTEKALELPKIVGDMLGMCGFAVMMGIGRLFYGFKGSQLNMNNALILGSGISIICYIIVAVSPFNWLNLVACCVCGLGASLLWPGTLVISSARYPMSGAWLFAILAAAGDIGAGVGTWIAGAIVDTFAQNNFVVSFASNIGMSTEQMALRFGVGISAIFPVICFVVHLVLSHMKKRELIA